MLKCVVGVLRTDESGENMTDRERTVNRLNKLIKHAHNEISDFVYLNVETAKLIVKMLEEQEVIMEEKKKPFFSVIVTAHDAEEFLKTALHSVRIQTFTDYELIVVCDKCKDKTSDIALGYADRTLIREYGLCGLARNAGLDAANGEYVLFMDDDDHWMHEHAFEMIAEEVKVQRPDILLFGFHWKGKGNVYQSPTYRTWAVWNKCWRREYIGDLRFDDYEYGEDVAFSKKMFLNGPCMAYLDSPLYYYNFMRPNSQTWKKERGLVKYGPRGGDEE